MTSGQAALALLAPRPILDPRQEGGDHEKTELPAACQNNEYDAADRQDQANRYDAFAAIEVAQDGFVSLEHGSRLLCTGRARIVATYQNPVRSCYEIHSSNNSL